VYYDAPDAWLPLLPWPGPARDGDAVTTSRTDASDSAAGDGPTSSVAAPERPTAPAKPTHRRWPASWTSERVALWLFVAYLVGAFFLLLHIGSYRWFLGDEWDFLSARSATNIHDLLRPHNQHWSTVPLIIYRGIYNVFGIRTYLPYQIPVLLSHLTMCGLIRVILRRMNIGPWLATVAAGTLVLFGPGQDDINWAFQIGFSLAAVLALTQFILADHPGRIDRRDWLGLGAGALALMCSGQAPPIILATGIAVLVKRSWKIAAFHTVPLGLMFGIWYKGTNASLQGLLDNQGSTVQIPPLTLGDAAHWAKTAVQGVLDGFGYFPILGLVVAIVLVVGWAAAFLTNDWATLRQQAALPAALLIGAVVGSAATAPQRFFLSPDEARTSRYLMISVALCLPALVFAANTILQRWRWTTPAMFALFLVPAPLNALQFNQFDNGVNNPAFYQRLIAFVTGVANSPLLEKTPAWVRPNASLVGMPDMTVGWLAEAKKEGKLPDPIPMGAPAKTQLPVQLGVSVITDVPTGKTCQTHTTPFNISPAVGDTWIFHGTMTVSSVQDGKRTSFPVAFSDAAGPNSIEIAAPGLQLLIEPGKQPGKSFELCT
jgi:hypothetical protein